jgi:hypothetical protein
VKVTSKPENYQEAPWLYKHNGLYYLAYASTCCPEGIGYCTSKSPMGPWSYQGLIMQGQKASAGNHPGIIEFKGISYLFGFNAALPGGGNQRRSVCADNITYNTDGTIPLHDWSLTGPRQIGTFNPYVQTTAATMAWSYGVRVAKDSTTADLFITRLDNNDFIKLRSVDFGEGARIFEAKVAAVSNGSSIEIHLDSLNGILAGNLTVKPTGGGQIWKNLTAKIKNTKGIHDVYFVFKGKEADLFNFKYWRFIPI